MENKFVHMNQIKMCLQYNYINTKYDFLSASSTIVSVSNEEKDSCCTPKVLRITLCSTPLYLHSAKQWEKIGDNTGRIGTAHT